MAVIAPTFTRVEDFKDDAHVITWTPLTQSGLDSGTPIKMPGSADRCVQVLGTFGAGGSVRIEGSNVPNPTVDADYTVLTDPQGNALDLTAARIEQITEIPLWIRPRVTAGDGTTSLTVRLLVRRPPT
jgi:hypothetical protein